MTTNGFIVIDRKLFEGWVWALPHQQFRVVLACLFLANWKERKWYDGTELIHIGRGEFITSLDKLAKFSKVSVGTVRRALTVMSKDGMISTHTKTNRWTKITINNYSSYQDVRHTDDTTGSITRGTPEAHSRYPTEPSNQVTKKPKEEERPPDLNSLAQEAQKPLPWHDLIPWMGQNLFWWDQIKKPDEFASKILNLCLSSDSPDSKGIPWPHLQEKLLDSSQFLEANQTERKPAGARMYYWNQAERFKYSEPEPKPKDQPRQGYSADEDWPTGITLKVIGQDSP